jgi:hypothetical protein
MAVLHFDHKEAQELLLSAGGNQQREGPSIVCRAFLAVFQIACPLLYKWRLVVVELLYDWQGNEG